MDTAPKLYLNGTALKGYDYEAQMNITGEKLYDLVVEGEICPVNENGEYLLKEPRAALRKLDLFLQVIPHKKSFLEMDHGRVESITHYYEDGLIDAIVYNTMYEIDTGATAGHAKQLERYANNKNLYIYKNYKTKVISWLRNQLYQLPICIKSDVDCEMELIELTIKGKIQKRPIIFRYKDKTGTMKVISLLGCRLPFTEGDEPLVTAEIMRKMPCLHYELAKAANQSDEFLIEIAKQGLQDAGYNVPMPAISGGATECLSLVRGGEKTFFQTKKSGGSNKDAPRMEATEAAIAPVFNDLDRYLDLNGKIRVDDFCEQVKVSMASKGTADMFHGSFCKKWAQENLGRHKLGVGEKLQPKTK